MNFALASRERFWNWRRKRLGKAIKHGRLRPLEALLAPRISLDAILAASRSVEKAIPVDVIDRFRGSDIVLIGPGEQGLTESDLERVGVVARMGFSGPSSVPKRTTSRCDIGFYTGTHVARLRDVGGAGEWSSHVPAVAVFRREVTAESLTGLSNQVRAVSFDDNPVKKIFRGIVPNFGPEVIVYLLALSPSRLAITHIDLFTTARYPAGYANKYVVEVDRMHHVREREAVHRSLSWHNPFTHFSFFQALAQSQSIVMCDQLEAIVASGLHAYRRRLNELYFDS